MLPENPNEFSWPSELGGKLADLDRKIEERTALLQFAYSRLKGVFDESGVMLPALEVLDEEQINKASEFIAEEDKGQVMLLTSKFLEEKKRLNDLILLLQKRSYN